MTWKIPLFKSYWEEDDVGAVESVIRRGTYWATGPEIEKFENKISEFVGRKYTLTFNSGTSALHSALLAHGINDGEVIVPSFTFISTASTIVLAGGKPVFAEIEDDSYGLDAEDVNDRITDKTRAIIPVHYGGSACRDSRALKEIAEDHSLLLIEDAAESLGSTVNDKMVGTFGDSGMFSFCQNKVITTGEGGAIVTDSEDIYEKLKLIRSHGRVEIQGQDYFSNSKDMDYVEVGYNYRMPTMAAALGISQLCKIEKIIKMRVDNATHINRELSGINSLRTPKVLDGCNHSYQLYTIQMETHEQRNTLQKYLTDKGIMTKVYFNPIHLKTLYRRKFGFKEGNLPRTEDISQRVLTLPMYPNLTKDEMNYMTKSVKELLQSRQDG